MLLFEPNRTEFDLSWRMFGVPVRVHPMFWLMGAFTGWSWVEIGLEYLLIWIACFFVSVLIHELGHIFMGRLFGSEGHIVLYGFGGLAIGSNALSNRWQRIAVSFAGPLAGFLYLGILVVAMVAFAPDEFDFFMEKLKSMLGLPFRPDVFFHKPTLMEALIESLLILNLLINVLNLLPVLPLDGGHIAREIATGLNPREGERIALLISIALAGLIALHGLTLRFGRPLVPVLTELNGGFLALMFGLLAFSNILALQQLSQRPWREDYPSQWDRGDDWRRPGNRHDDWRR